MFQKLETAIKKDEAKKQESGDTKICKIKSLYSLESRTWACHKEGLQRQQAATKGVEPIKKDVEKLAV